LFFYAVNHNKYEKVEAMFQQGFNPNSTCGGHTALHIAVVKKDEAMVKLLLKYNADAIKQCGDFVSSFELALLDDFCVDLFIKHNAHLLLFEIQNNQINNINLSTNYIEDGGSAFHQSLLFNQLLTKMHSTDNDDKNNFLT
jgi:ankyrin repeat protein